MKGYIETCRVAAFRKLGELSLSLNSIMISKRCYTAHLQIMSDIEGWQLEIIRGEALWKMSQLCHEEIRAKKSISFANESLVKFERELLPDDPLIQNIKLFLVASQPLQLSNLMEPAEQESKLNHHGD